MRATLLQIAAPIGDDDPYAVLGARRGEPLVAIERKYRERCRQAHPDAGGSHAEMVRLNAAMTAIRAGQPPP